MRETSASTRQTAAGTPTAGRPASVAALLVAIASLVVWITGIVLLILDAGSSLGATSSGYTYDGRFLPPGLVLTSLAPLVLGGVALVLGLVATRRARRGGGRSRMSGFAVVAGGITCGLGLLATLLALATDRFSLALSVL